MEATYSLQDEVEATTIDVGLAGIAMDYRKTADVAADETRRVNDVAAFEMVAAGRGLR